MNNLFNRHIDEYRRIIRNLISNALRKVLGQFLHFGFDQLGRFQCIGSRLQINGKSDRFFAVKRGTYAVILSAEFYPGNVFKPQHTAFFITFQDNFAELLFIDQTSFSVDGICIGLIFVHRLLAKLSGGKLRVLLLHRRNNILRRQIIFRQTIRTEPDTH